MAKNSKGLSKQEEARLDARAKLIDEASKSVEGYSKALEKVGELQYQINAAIKERGNLEAEITKLGIDLKNASASEKVNISNLLIKKKALYVTQGKILKQAKTQLDLDRAALEAVDKKVMALKSVWSLTKGLTKSLINQTGWLLEQQKSIKETELSMGILSSQAGAFRKNIYKASLTTTEIGISSKDLAKIQGTYSEEIGRSVQLSEEQLVSIANLAKGTTLGAEGAAQFAANMENFGISAQGSADLVEGMLNSSHKMGINSSKVIKAVQKNMKLANKYHFKGGIKGLTRMASLATKFKFEMESIAGFAENLITPEGAIEAAAKLQVLGGEWAKLGDPFELMFRARNDIEGLTEDIIDATKNTARWNEETGEFTIDPMELHRLREVAKVTGQSAEELARMAKEKAKFEKIKGGITGVNEEDKDFIASLTQFNKKSGKFEVTYQNEMGVTTTKAIEALTSLDKSRIATMKNEEQSLEKRAKQSLTFDDSWKNLINTFKSTILPGFEGVSKVIQGFLVDFRTWADNNKLFEGLANMTSAIGNFVADNPIKSAIAVGLGIIGKEASWLMRGRLLGMGFNSKASVGGAGAGGYGASSPIGGRRGQKGSPRSKARGRGMKGGGAALLGGLALDVGRGFLDDPDGNLGKGMGVGASALEWGGTGAMIGSLIAPGIGTAIGAALGGIGGGLYGMYSEGMFDKDKSQTPMYNDFISRPGSNPVSFSGSDTLIGAKKGGPIDKLLDNSSGVKATSGKVIVEFNKPMQIEGKIEISSGNQTASIDLTDPILMREITRVIQEQLTSNISGGKISSNPVR